MGAPPSGGQAVLKTVGRVKASGFDSSVPSTYSVGLVAMILPFQGGDTSSILVRNTWRSDGP